MKSITLYLILSVSLSAKLSLIDAAPPKDFPQLLQPLIDHFEEFKQKADKNDNLDGIISDLKKDIQLLKSELVAADVQIEVKENIIRVQDEKISKLVNKNKLLYKQINESVEEKAQLNNQITDLTEQLQNLNSEWDMAKEVIKTKEEDINLKSNEILMQNELLMNKEIRIEELEDQSLLKDREIDSKNEKISRILQLIDSVLKIKMI